MFLVTFLWLCNFSSADSSSWSSDSSLPWHHKDVIRFRIRWSNQKRLHEQEDVEKTDRPCSTYQPILHGTFRKLMHLLDVNAISINCLLAWCKNDAIGEIITNYELRNYCWGTVKKLPIWQNSELGKWRWKHLYSNW